MMIKFVRFNIYLSLAVGFALLTGCQSSKDKDKKVTTLELHLEINADGGKDNQTVPVFREHPMYITVDREFFVDTPDVASASVVDELGGFALRIQFNWRGTQLLTSTTQANRGKRICVLADFPEPRWLAAPMIRKSITDGVLTFTPDCSREEADRIVKGLNDVAAAIKKSEKL
jgi:hypothetical protein